MASLEGALLSDTYKIGAKLGAGGMGEVYSASHTRLRRKLAVKVLRSLEGSDSFARFRREAEITSELGHPNIIQVLDFNETPDGAPYIVMEKLEGEDLHARLKRRGKLSLKKSLHIFEQVASALAAAHAKGIVHRDLKPQNVFLCAHPGDDCYVKVLDFGISKVQGSHTVVTGSQAVVGTPKYMAPEQAKGESREVDTRADQFALAAMLYEMLAGQSAFSGDSVPSLLYKVVHEHPTPLDELAPDTPTEIVAAVSRAMAKRRQDRFPSMQAFVASVRGEEPSIDPDEVIVDGDTLDGSDVKVGTAETVTNIAFAETSASADESEADSTTNNSAGERAVAVSAVAARSKRRLWLVGVAVVALASGGVIYSQMSGENQAKAPEASASPGLSSDSPEAEAKPTITPTSTAEIQFAITPVPDRIVVDGTPIKGQDIVLPVNDRLHKVRAEKAGHEPWEASFVADRAQRLSAALKPTKTASRAAKPAKAKRGKARRSSRKISRKKKPIKKASSEPAPTKPVPKKPAKKKTKKFVTDF